MTYVFDTSSFRVLDFYFPTRFPAFWNDFNGLVGGGRIVSVREVRNELDNQPIKPHLRDWVNNNRSIFLLPEPRETEFVRKIFSVSHFRQIVAKKNRLRGWPLADPFVVASAYYRRGCVVTEEAYKPNAAKIPNICEHYEIDCLCLEDLMKKEGWVF
jgi:hypothetical protein